MGDAKPYTREELERDWKYADIGNEPPTDWQMRDRCRLLATVDRVAELEARLADAESEVQSARAELRREIVLRRDADTVAHSAAAEAERLRAALEAADGSHLHETGCRGDHDGLNKDISAPRCPWCNADLARLRKVRAALAPPASVDLSRCTHGVPDTYWTADKVRHCRICETPASVEKQEPASGTSREEKT